MLPWISTSSAGRPADTSQIPSESVSSPSLSALSPSSPDQVLTASSDTAASARLSPPGNPFLFSHMSTPVRGKSASAPSVSSPVLRSLSRPLPVSGAPTCPSDSPWSPSTSSSPPISPPPPFSGGFPTKERRWSFYSSINPCMHWSLDTPLALSTVQEALPSTIGSFFPTQQDLLEHSLGVANGLFSVRPSSAVPGEYGLFLDFSHPPYSSPTLLGCYTGWVHAFEDGDSGSPPFTSPVFDMYCLDIGHGLIVTAFDSSLSHEQRAFLFPYSFANEFIWHPEGNLLSFGENGTVFFGAHGNLTIHSELFMSFGPQHDWSALRHALMLRSLDTLHALAMGLGLHDWAALLLPHRAFLQSTSLPDILASSSPSLGPLLLIHALVDWYQLHSLSGHVHSFPGDSLGSWISRCAKVRLFSIHHVFRKANHPARPPYDLPALVTQLLAIHAPPDRSRTGRSLRPVSSIRQRSFIHDPQDPHEDLLSDHFLSPSIPSWFSSPPDFGLPPSLDLPFPQSPLGNPVPSTPSSLPLSAPQTPSPSPRMASRAILLSPFAPYPMILSPTWRPRNSLRTGGLLVSLAISFERPSDRKRIIQLLQHFAVVISVSHISLACH